MKHYPQLLITCISVILRIIRTRGLHLLSSSIDRLWMYRLLIPPQEQREEADGACGKNVCARRANEIKRAIKSKTKMLLNFSLNNSGITS